MDIHELIRQIHNLPYIERRRLAATIRGYNRFIYKFRSLNPNDETAVDRIRDILVRSRLWLSSPLDFNDPFDMSGKIVATSTAAERLARFKNALKEQGISYKEREKKAREYARKPIAEYEALIDKSFQKHKAATGVYSFGGDARNILMWSHYSQNHAGLCLQFETARDFSVLSQALNVKYSSEYPIINYIKDFQNGLESVLLRKHEGWSYEKESRIIKPGLAHSYISFDPQAITGIIIGCRTPKDSFETIKSILDERRKANLSDIAIYFAHKHLSRYKLTIIKQLRDDLK